MTPSLPVLERVVARYRRDVHTLATGASPDAVAALEQHLGRRLPPELRAFLLLHNGGTLFRGVLTLRTTSQITPAEADSPIVVFADGAEGTRWAFVARGDRTHFGICRGSGLDPVYASFVAWLEGEIGLLEARVVRDEDADAHRHELLPRDPVVALRRGRRLVAEGRPEEAVPLAEELVRTDPTDAAAWQLLGDARSAFDRVAAEGAWLQAFRKTTLPLPWAGAPCLSPDAVAALAAARLDDPEWERELDRFLDEQVGDVADAASHALAIGAALVRSRSLVKRGRRKQARDGLAAVVARSRAWSFREVPWDALLELAQLQVGLGDHDDAEAILRSCTRHGPPAVRVAGSLLLAEIAVTRQEPWAEDILDEAAEGPLEDVMRLQLVLLRAERAVRLQRPAEAAKAIEGIEKLAKRVGLPRLDALATVARADAARLRRRPDDALELYRRALDLVGDRDGEVRGRILLRLSDLAFEQGDSVDGRELALSAARLFGALDLPIREAWAWMRVARGEHDPGRARLLLQNARERFAGADLAAGVAAVDSLAGDAGGSLLWHLERASVQARTRADAQRGRPPYEPLDADRPERRLGAHRLAIAACEPAVVATLARELDATARAVTVGRGRPTDPPVLRYLAAVDLLSGHPSYEAAAVLLDHVLRRELDPVLSRGLQGAIARSPNAALVDGLLRCIERPTEHPAPSVAAAAELLGIRREPVALDPLVGLLSGPVSTVVKRAVLGALGRIGNRAVTERLLPSLDDGRLAEAAGLALLMLGDRRGVDFHARALQDQRSDLTGSPGEIVGRYGGPEHLLFLLRGVEAGGERGLGCLQGLGLLGDARGAPVLLQALHAKERQTVEVASGALTILTGHVEDPAEPGVRARWHEWWERTGREFAPGVRHRFGKPFELGALVDRMDDLDPYVRRTAYDELVIASGQALPFDADGPIRVQIAHKRAWRRWVSSTRARFLPGRWVLDGQVIA